AAAARLPPRSRMPTMRFLRALRFGKSSTRPCLRLAATVIFTLFCAIRPAAAQSAFQLVVTVLDPADQAMPGATVTVEQNGALVLSAVADASGQAVVSAPRAGSYQVKATLDGFSDAAPVSVRLAGAQAVRITVRLGLPRVTDSVVVAGSAESPSAETAVRND